ncbi:MAG: hypothetical protein ACM3YE_08825 [Bacteroidota bacterium]
MRKYIVIALIIILMLNFAAFWLSIWPYDNPVGISGQNQITDYNAVRMNFKLYLIISSLSFISAIIIYKAAKKVKKGEA